MAALTSLLWTLVATVIVFIGLFLFHFLYLTPRRIIAETDERLELAEGRANRLSFEDNSPRIRFDVADEAGRKELEKTRAELEKAQATIRALDPIRQPIASVAVLADVFIKSDQPFDNHYMDRGAWFGFARGSEALLATSTGESLAKTMSEGEVLFRGVFNSPINGPFVGKPIPELAAAEYVQVDFLMLPADAEVLRGTITVTLNGTQRFEFLVPPQKAMGQKIVARDLSPMMSKLPAGPAGNS